VILRKYIVPQGVILNKYEEETLQKRKKETN